jgi:hypothetical protein
VRAGGILPPVFPVAGGRQLLGGRTGRCDRGKQSCSLQLVHLYYPPGNRQSVILAAFQKSADGCDHNKEEHMKIRPGVALFGLLAVTGAAVQAATLDLTTNNDANIYNRASGDPYGTDNLLGPFTGSTYSVYSYIGFDVSAFQALGQTAAAVSLDLYGFTTVSSLQLNIYGLNDAMTTGWSENTIDWNNAPGKLANSIDPAATTLLFSGPVSYTNNGLVGFAGSTFTDFINSDTDGSVTFILTQGDAVQSSNHAFSSKESAGNPSLGHGAGDFAPQLSISTVPLPGAGWLLLGGLLGLAGIGRRNRAASA